VAVPQYEIIDISNNNISTRPYYRCFHDVFYEKLKLHISTKNEV